MKKIHALFILVLFIVCLPFFEGCATEAVFFKIENSLPSSRLEYYSDSFDKLREDLWEKAGFVYEKEQLKNYKSANMQIEKGSLVFKTEIGTFSKGGLVARYELKGDFDVQIDCKINFSKEEKDMDQILSFAVLEKGPLPQENRLVAISLIKVAQEGSGIFSSYRDGKLILGKSWYPIGDFHGSLRIVRAGEKVSTYYKRQGESWRRRDIFPSSGGNARIGFIVQNFAMQRRSVHATAPVIGEFDNFRINAAQTIIEDEI
jgi:hypothetical protein